MSIKRRLAIIETLGAPAARRLLKTRYRVKSRSVPRSNLRSVSIPFGVIFALFAVFCSPETLAKPPTDSPTDSFTDHAAIPSAEVVSGTEGGSSKKESSETNAEPADYLSEAQASPARWELEKMPLSIYIESRERPESKILESAFKDWAKASGKKISFEFVSDPEKASIACSFTNKVSELASPLEGGETLVSKTADGHLLKANIKILLFDAKDKQAVTAAAFHETGHSFGLGHSSQPGDAMFPYFKPDAFSGKLSKRDQKTIRLIYDSTFDQLAKYARKDVVESAGGDGPLQQAIQLNAEASKNFARGNFAAAVPQLEKANKLAPNTAVIEENLARAYLQLADLECQKENFADGEKHLRLTAELFLKLHKTAEALRTYKDLSRLARVLKNETRAVEYDAKIQEIESRKLNPGN